MTDNEEIIYPNPSGGPIFYIRVFYGNAGNEYDLWWDDQTQPDDCYEVNNDRSMAYDLSYHEGAWLSTLGCSGIQSDSDYYQIYVDQDFIHVRCTFTHAAGDIDLQLEDASGNPLMASRSVTDNEEIVFDARGRAPATYYILVHYGDQGNAYDLWWDDLAFDPTTLEPAGLLDLCTRCFSGQTDYRELFQRSLNWKRD
jgi:hypothetical protein